ncbi:hypothetical protein, partial [Shigella sp. SHS-5]|uniref:hypothetical protein n=1 Tax=Shigella sp. SHS-5 TaxID=2116504 RepID=UPI001C0A7C7F
MNIRLQVGNNRNRRCRPIPSGNELHLGFWLRERHHRSDRVPVGMQDRMELDTTKKEEAECVSDVLPR